MQQHQHQQQQQQHQHQHQQAIVQPQDVYHRMRNAQPGKIVWKKNIFCKLIQTVFANFFIFLLPILQSASMFVLYFFIDPFNLRYSNSQGGASTNIHQQSGMMQQRQTQHNMSLMQQQQQQLMQVAHHHQHQHQHQHQQYHSQFHQNQQAFAGKV